MSKQLFQAIAEVTKIETLANNCLKLILRTNEVTEDQAAHIFGLREKQGWFLFKPTSINANEIKDLPEIKLDTDEKSPAQRFRATLYVYWEQTGGSKRADKKTFEQYYREYMEKLINAIKEKLN